MSCLVPRRSYQDGYHIDLLTAIDTSDSMRRSAVEITLVYTRTRIAKGVYPIPGTGMRALRAQIIIGPALVVDFERLMSPSLSVLLQKCSVVF